MRERAESHTCDSVDLVRVSRVLEFTIVTARNPFATSRLKLKIFPVRESGRLLSNTIDGERLNQSEIQMAINVILLWMEGLINRVCI